jgi:plastocyanin
MRSLFTALSAVILVALLTACSSNTSSPSPVSPTPTVPSGGGGGGSSSTVTILGVRGSGSYSPPTVTVKVGDSIAWMNSDSITHTATASNGAFNTGNVAPGSTSAPVTMTTAGTFDYMCTIHPSMTGTVVVTQ